MILHIPHASRIIPPQFRDQFVLDDMELERELTRMTDAYTDELFDAPGGSRVVFPYSRLLVDVERFRDDKNEPMAAVGMGSIYSKTSQGERLRRSLTTDERILLLSAYFDHHHRQLEQSVDAELQNKPFALIVDCHSFPSRPLPCDQDQARSRPDFCIGVDDYHTPASLVVLAEEIITKGGYSVAVNRPYRGSIVPAGKHRKDKRVTSIMIEVNRKLYLDECSGNKMPMFAEVGFVVRSLLVEFGNCQFQLNMSSHA